MARKSATEMPETYVLVWDDNSATVFDSRETVEAVLKDFVEEDGNALEKGRVYRVAEELIPRLRIDLEPTT